VIEANDTVIEGAGEGIDTVQTSRAAYTLKANFENLVFTGAGGFTGRGNALDNTIGGGAGDDSLSGGAGDDILVGGGGTDLADYRLAANEVTVSLADGAALDDGDGGSDTLIGFENLGGSAYDDALTGDAGGNVLTGWLGDDVLQGGAGNDQLFGSAGVDTASYAAAGAAVSVRLNANTASDGEGGTDVLNAIENAIGSAYNDLLVGNAVGNALTGGLGRDTLLGLGGNDILIGGTGAANQMQGGLGDDLYLVDAVGDTLLELVGEGTDRVQTTLDRYALRANIEDLSYAGWSDFAGVGNALNNLIAGGAGNDSLTGGQGDDTLFGGDGFDVAIVSGASTEYLVEDLGSGRYRVTDTVGGRDGIDILDGVEAVRFTNGTYFPAPAATPASAKTFEGAEVPPTLSGDDFVLPKAGAGPQVLPQADQSPEVVASPWLERDGIIEPLRWADGAWTFEPGVPHAFWDDGGWML
jgi:Ca2+-binding RTX toxin-like protein